MISSHRDHDPSAGYEAVAAHAAGEFPTPCSGDTTAGPPGRAWQISRHLMLEQKHRDHVVLFHTLSSRRWRLSSQMYALLLKFRSPKTLAQVYGDSPPTVLTYKIARLSQSGLLNEFGLEAEATATRVRGQNPYRFCGTPAFEAAGTDFVILGAPYDLAGDIDCREAPTLVRQKSYEHPYRLELSDGTPSGWFDPNRDERILFGARIADAGDARPRYGESQREYFDRIGNCIDEFVSAQAIPVVIGGDASISYAVCARLRRYVHLSIVRFTDPHESSQAPASEAVIADEVTASMLRLDGVRHVLCVDIDAFANSGARSSARTYSHANAPSFSSEYADRDAGIARTFADLSGDVHISIDLRILAPHMVATKSSFRPQDRFDRINQTIRALSERCRIVGIDLVGMDSRSPWTHVLSSTACHLLLRTMHSAFEQFRSTR